MVSAAIPPRRVAVTGFLADSMTPATTALAVWRAHCRPTSNPSANVRPRITSTAPPSAIHWAPPAPPPTRRRAEEAMSVALVAAAHAVGRRHTEQVEPVPQHLAHRGAEAEAGRVAADLLQQLLHQHELATALGHPHRLAVAQQGHELDDEHVEALG